MQKLLHALIAIALAVVVLGGLAFVLGQTLFLVIGQPAWVVLVEKGVETVIFPAIAVVGVLCYVYSAVCLRKKASTEGAEAAADD